MKFLRIQTLSAEEKGSKRVKNQKLFEVRVVIYHCKGVDLLMTKIKFLRIRTLSVEKKGAPKGQNQKSLKGKGVNISEQKYGLVDSKIRVLQNK